MHFSYRTQPQKWIGHRTNSLAVILPLSVIEWKQSKRRLSNTFSSIIYALPCQERECWSEFAANSPLQSMHLSVIEWRLPMESASNGSDNYNLCAFCHQTKAECEFIIKRVPTYDLYDFWFWTKVYKCKLEIDRIFDTSTIFMCATSYATERVQRYSLTFYVTNMLSFQRGGSSGHAPAAACGAGRNPGCGVTQPWQPLQQSSLRFKGNCLSLEGQVFNCSDYKQANQYQSTIKQISK